MNEDIEQNEYELGANVTHLASSGGKKATTVVSVRLTASEIAKLDGIGRESGKTASQVIRDAIAAYRIRRPTMVVGIYDGTTVSIGEPQSVSANTRCEFSFTRQPGNFTGAGLPV